MGAVIPLDLLFFRSAFPPRRTRQEQQLKRMATQPHLSGLQFCSTALVEILLSAPLLSPRRCSRAGAYRYSAQKWALLGLAAAHCSRDAEKLSYCSLVRAKSCPRDSQELLEYRDFFQGIA